jgi:hypothetical protein
VSDVKITAELRSEFGKGAARRLRRADKVPAVLYGHGTDPLHLSPERPEAPEVRPPESPITGRNDWTGKAGDMSILDNSMSTNRPVMV